MGEWGCVCGMHVALPPCFRGLSGAPCLSSYLLCSGLGTQLRHQWQLDGFVSVMSLTLECRLSLLCRLFLPCLPFWWYALSERGSILDFNFKGWPLHFLDKLRLRGCRPAWPSTKHS